MLREGPIITKKITQCHADNYHDIEILLMELMEHKKC